MAGSSHGSRRNAESKRKYSSGPLMKVEKQIRNLDGIAYQVISTDSLAQTQTPRKIVFQADKSSFQFPSTLFGAIDASGSPENKPPPSITDHSFVVNTIDSMKNGGEWPTVSLDSPNLYTPVLDDGSLDGKRRKLMSEPQILRKHALRSTRPLKISDKVNSDIWQIILGYCAPKLLLDAKTINKEFRQLLSDRTAIWRASRQNFFGHDMPECPIGMTEQAYADLLVGRGCQNQSCPKEHTAGVYWTFQVRLCAECFRQKTMRADELPVHRRHILNPTTDREGRPLWEIESEGRPLWELLPLARSDGRRYMRPRSVDTSTNVWANAHSLRQYVFLKSAYTQLETQYLHLLRSEPTPAQLNTWIHEIHSRTMEFMVEVDSLETWYKRQKISDSIVHNIREHFFISRAAELSPPMKRSVLWKMAAFRRSLKVQTPPTERSWNTLKAKILPYRLHAEIVEQYELDMLQGSGRFSHTGISSSTPTAIKLYRQLHEHRSGLAMKPEQEFVLELGRREFKRCLENKVADADLVLLCLKNVFETYGSLSEVPDGLNYDGTYGRYRLSLDDARMIVEEVMEKHIPKMSLRGGRVFQSFRCRGCRRRDFIRSWSFVEAFEHMLQVHATVVGQGLEFWQFAVPYIRDLDEFTRRDHGAGFPWYTVAWPRCLPLIPVHQDPWALDSWHPTISIPFEEYAQKASVSAFEDRIPRPTEIAHDDFIGNLLHAAKTLNGAWLEGPCQMKIALKYAVDLYSPGHMLEPPLSKFAACLELFHDANPAIELRFRCGACVGEASVYRTARQVKYKISVEALLSHWEEKHLTGGHKWSQSLLQLPSDTEVMQQIREIDQKLRQDREATRERTEQLQLAENVRKRPRLKASLVMNARSPGEIFDQLFDRVNESGSQN